jgi:hypothetical protein
VPIDASFKQHTFTQGIDLLEVVPFDSEKEQLSFKCLVAHKQVLPNKTW